MSLLNSFTSLFRAGAVVPEYLWDELKNLDSRISSGSEKTKKTVTVTVATGNSQGSSSADSTLVGGIVVGFYPSSLTESNLKSIVLNADGSITATLLAAATGTDSYSVIVEQA